MRILLRLLCCLVPFFVQAQQLRFNASTANVDSFPVVRFNITVSENGSIPSPALTASDFTILDDGKVVSPQLVNCDDSRRVAVAICIDHSGSMIGSAGDYLERVIYPSFIASFDTLIGHLTPASKYALLPFTKTCDTVYPQPPHPGGFYQGQNPADYAEAVSVIHGLTFYGGTDVDNALFRAAKVLEYSGVPTKVIVLVSDDFIKYPDSVRTRLQDLGIMLCTFQPGSPRDSDVFGRNFPITQSTGGLYFWTEDSTIYDDIMREIAQHILAEHCELSYTSSDPCPWYRTHQVSLTLNRGSLSRNILRAYSLGYNVNDTTPPPLSVVAPTYITRRVRATGDYPCERGLKDFRDSLRQNIGVFQRSRSYPSFGTDSLRVQDSLYPARAIYVAVDSANNRAVLEFTYVPQPDTLAPEIALVSSAGGNYRALITELRPWDRGLVNVLMAPGAVNLLFDSVTWYSRTTGQIWFHQPDPTGVSTGCIEVRDSVGNVGTYCIDRAGPAGDTLPPIITQNALAIPRTTVSAGITELRQNDRGIKQIASSSLVNFANPQINWTNIRQASISFRLVDSLTAARAFVSASDSADNVAADTIRYDPLPDNTPPLCVVETTDVSTRTFRTTEFAPWDRGIRDVTIIGSITNLFVSPVVFVNRFEAEQPFTLIDKTLPGNVVISATDSAGHTCLTTINIEPSETPPTPLQPLTTASMLDFTTVFAPADVTLPLSITNPNDRPVVVTRLDLIGSQEFSVLNGTTPFFFAPLQTRSLDIRYQPNLLGTHGATLTLANDTMQLSQSAILGQAIGRVRLHFDSVSVDAPNMSSTLHLSIDATPDPINLDTIKFTIVYNADVAVLSPLMPDCSGGNPLCDSSLTYSGDPDLGTIDVELIRTVRSRNQSLTNALARLDIPFFTYLAKDAETSVYASNILVSQSSVISGDSGLIHVGSDGCGTELIRAFLGKTAPFSIVAIAPNPATESITVSVRSAAGSDATVALYDMNGACVLKMPVQLQRSANKIAIDCSALAGGSYTVAISSSNGFVTAKLLVKR